MDFTEKLCLNDVAVCGYEKEFSRNANELWDRVFLMLLPHPV